MTMKLKLSDIRIDGGTQSRVALNDATSAEYTEVIESGVTLPPVDVFFDGAVYWLADGFHRFIASKRVGCVDMDATIHQGSLTDAQLFAFGANQTHGLRRTNEDKRKAVEGVLGLKPDWSNSKISRHVGVSDMMVADRRKAILKILEDAPATRTVERNGKTFTQDVSGQKAAGEAKKAANAAAKPEPTIKQELESKTRSSLPAAEPPSIVANRKPGPVSEVPAGMEYSEEDQLRDMLRTSMEENEALNDRLSVAVMDATDEEKAQATETIRELRAMVKTLTAELDAVKSSRDVYLVENAELKRQCASHVAKLKKLGSWK